jgi:hypothetical protein
MAHIFGAPTRAMLLCLDIAPQANHYSTINNAFIVTPVNLFFSSLLSPLIVCKSSGPKMSLS